MRPVVRIGIGWLCLSLGLLILGLTGGILRARWRGTIAGVPPPIPRSGEPPGGPHPHPFRQNPEDRRRGLAHAP
ncbi:MAG: hypothetical protein ACO2PQ_13380, partial [Thermoflexus sp.]